MLQDSMGKIRIPFFNDFAFNTKLDFKTVKRKKRIFSIKNKLY